MGSVIIYPKMIAPIETVSNVSLLDLRRRIIASQPHLETKSGDMVSFNTNIGAKAKNLMVDVEPVQNLNGYDHPWPAGGGKNLIPLSLSNIKAANTNGTWSGNSYTYNGLTFTVLVNEIEEVVGVTVNGTNVDSIATHLYLGQFNSNTHLQIVPGNNYYMSGGASNAKMITWRYDSSGAYIDLSGNSSTQIGALINNSASVTQYTPVIQVARGITVQSETVYPMVYVGTSQAPPFEPYSNPCPITGWTGAKVAKCGKNLLPTPYVDGTKTQNGVTFTPNSDGTVTIIGTATNTTFFNFGNASHTFVLKAGRYVKTVPNASGSIQFNLHDKTGLAIASNQTKEFELTDDTECYCRLRISRGTEINTPIVVYPQIELGSTATAYEPYQGDTYDIAFPSEAGTVYGGKLNASTGDLTVTDFVYTFDGTENIKKSSAALNGYYIQLYRSSRPHNWPEMADYSYINQSTKELSSMFTITYDVDEYLEEYNFAYFDSGINFSCDPEIFGNTVTAVKSKLADLYSAGTPVSFYLRILNPIVYHLSPQQISLIKGANNVFTDCGDTTITYWTN